MQKMTPLKSIFEKDEAVAATFPIFLDHIQRANHRFLRDIRFRKWDTVAKNAHKAIGSAGSYGFPTIVKVLQALEREAKGPKRYDISLIILGRYSELVSRVELGVNEDEISCSAADQYETC